ncbi:MAG: chemotaxis-specific protein-glutamate methyltransferase CheB [Granulosicoccus sp.]
MKRKRILIVDDSSLFQRLLSDVIDAHSQLEVAGVAANGKLALEMMPSLRPDLVTLDILMPELDGIQTLIQLRKQWPNIRTIMISTLTSKGSDAALDALALGASDYAVKPRSEAGMSVIRKSLSADLMPRIEALCGIEKEEDVVVLPKASQRARRASPVKPSGKKGSRVSIDLVAIGVSTGGPDALAKVLGEIPADLGVPIVIVQHMPASFTAKLAARLDSTSPMTVCEAQQGDKLRAGTIYIAPGEFHMVLGRLGEDVTVNLNKDAPENSCRPAVDPLFRSIPPVYGSRCLAVVMTGMGKDGFKGAQVLSEHGCPIIVQDKYTSIVWGMPKLVSLSGLAEEEVPLDKLASVIIARVRNTGPDTLSTKPFIDRKAVNADVYGHDKKIRGRS